MESVPQECGRVAGLQAETGELKDLAGMEETNTRVFADETLRAISRGSHQLVDPTPFSASVWCPAATR